ncbi:hypothetical protein K491DRAFT_281778 [Lophiostoma macrostomum CBS 122681]|uniref:C2H2-type domain-containing protein n=1 Tax=Lophiostoma macrostomum CBS 122681 TaxID=1314788 RepID=A0A6A6TQ02_9PLEO|nr:hypothetical protein K491DRAFT_281778 [Lophiostoma macrostomum CBS 122681]
MEYHQVNDDPVATLDQESSSTFYDPQVNSLVWPEQFQVPSSQCASTSGSARFSDHSTFSRHDWRISATSTNTSWSQGSSRSQFLPNNQSWLVLNENGAVCGYDHDGSATTAPQHNTHRRRISQDKEHYLTCVGRRERSNNSAKNPRYWCTSCRKGFGEKYDWKRHEEIYQERFEEFQCGLCRKAYFIDKDFAHHHQRRHSCQTCVENKHIEVARSQRRARSGWGCGFCLRYDTDWLERCRHIARHFKDGRTMDHWTQTQVILSLLEQPLIWTAWNHILASQEERDPSFSWSPDFTGRAEGYPDIDCVPQLQDLLEFFTPDQDAATLAGLAYELGHLQETAHVMQHSLYVPGSEPHLVGRINDHSTTVANALPTGLVPSQTSTSSPTDKELPSIPSNGSVPVEDGLVHPATTTPPALQYSAANFVAWQRLEDGIIPDEILPTGSSFDAYQPDFGPLDVHFNPNDCNF